MKEIISTKNEQLKQWKKLQTKKGRAESGRYLIEGFHLVEEAARANQEVEVVLYTKRGQAEWTEFLAQLDDSQKVFVSDEAMKAVSALPSPQGIAAVLKQTDVEKSSLNFSGGWLFLDNVQDPGNVGTMVRTADAFGLVGVVLGEGCADVYQPKVLRAMQGSQFHLQILQGKLHEWIPRFQKQKFQVYGTEVSTSATVLPEIKRSENFVLLLGNEGAGVNPELLRMTDQQVFIPLLGEAESLNVSIAAGILMYYFTGKE